MGSPLPSSPAARREPRASGGAAETPPRSAGGPAAGLVLGAAVVGGWVLHDLAAFLARVDARAAREILPGSLVLVAGGAVLGLAASLRPWVRRSLAVLVVVALAALLARGPEGIPTAAYWQPRALLLAVLGLCAARALAGRLGTGYPSMGPLRVGLAVGIACGAYFFVLLRQARQDAAAGAAAPLADLLVRKAPELSTETSVLLAGAGLALLLGLVRRAAPRRMATGALVAACALLVVLEGGRRAEGVRPDLPATAGPASGPNLVLVVLDTVAATHLAPYGYGRVTTPRLDGFAAEEATLYTEARSTSSWTLPSHASLFTGLLPGEHGATHLRTPPGAPRRRGVWPARPLRGDVPTLAERLRERGYRTGAIVANGFALGRQAALDRGFERYDARRGGWLQAHLALAQLAGFSLRSGHYPYRDARSITDLAIEWIDGRRRPEGPFFLFVNYMDAHWPYLPPPPFDRAFGGEQPRDPHAPERELHALLYDRALSYLDHHVGRLLEALRERGLWEGTNVIVTSDHGEAFGEHGFWRHDFALYEELIRVPLYVKPAGGRDVARVETPVTGADVHRLMLGLVGIAAPEAAAPPAPDGLPVVAEWYQQDLEATAQWEELFATLDVERDLITWLEGGRKWIVSSKGDVEAYDLTADPAERAPLVLGEGEIEEARRRALEWWATHIPPTVELQSLDEEGFEHLRALGYMGEG